MYGFNHRHHNSKKNFNIIKKNKYGKVLWIRSRYANQ